MKNFRWAVAAVLIFSISSCATLSGNPGFVAFGACTTNVLETAGKALLGDLTAVFAQADYEAEVAKLAAQSGTAEVACGVDLLIAELGQKKSLTKASSVVLTNAKAYRAAHPAG